MAGTTKTICYLGTAVADAEKWANNLKYKFTTARGGHLFLYLG